MFYSGQNQITGLHYQLQHQQKCIFLYLKKNRLYSTTANKNSYLFHV